MSKKYEKLFKAAPHKFMNLGIEGIEGVNSLQNERPFTEEEMIIQAMREEMGFPTPPAPIEQVFLEEEDLWIPVGGTRPLTESKSYRGFFIQASFEKYRRGQELEKEHKQLQDEFYYKQKSFSYKIKIWFQTKILGKRLKLLR